MMMIFQLEDVATGISDVTSFVPAVIVAAVFGITEVIKMWYLNKNGTTSPMPWWFIIIPGILGLVLGTAYYFAITPTEVLAGLTVTKKVLNSLFLGLGYGGASVLLFEIKKAWLTRPTN